MGLQEGFNKILREYKEVYEEIWKKGIFTNPLLDYFNNNLKEAVSTEVKKRNTQLLVDSSTGAGRTTKTPWIAIMDERITGRKNNNKSI